jgi:3-oxoacyl-[acyl-carrier-protein] synthase-3
VLEKAGHTADEVACIVPHQANQRIISAVGKQLGISPDRFFINLDKYGNTSAASVIIALDEARREGFIKTGDLVLLVVFGGGFTWGAGLVEWS